MLLPKEKEEKEDYLLKLQKVIYTRKSNRVQESHRQGISFQRKT